jgi:hypothetical protein
MTTTAVGMTSQKTQDTIEIEDDDASIDEEQLEEYREMVEQLGSFPVSCCCCCYTLRV